MSSKALLSLNKPSSVYVGGSYAVLLFGVIGFIIGLWNAEMQLNEKGYYFTVLAFGLFSAISLQKSVRDRQESVTVSSTYYGMCYVALGLALLLLVVGLWNATLLLSEKGYYAVCFVLAMYAGITVQKNTRDLQLWNSLSPAAQPDEPEQNAS